MKKKNIGVRQCTECFLLKHAKRILFESGRAVKKAGRKISTTEQFKKWSTGFSASVLILITTFWAVNNAYVLFLLSVQFFRYGILDSEVLKLFIEKINETFLASVVSILITRTVGNVFQFNNGGIFGNSTEMNPPNYVNPEESEEHDL